jgi:hypothetical protein
MKLTPHILALLLASALPSLALADPLPSWNSGAAKQAILDFVEKTTDPDSKDFVPLPERIAVFDNDGALWPENPVPFQLAFTLDELRRLGHQIEEREETFSTSYFGRPNAVMVQPGTGRLLGGVNQYKPTLAMGL